MSRFILNILRACLLDSSFYLSNGPPKMIDNSPSNLIGKIYLLFNKDMFSIPLTFPSNLMSLMPVDAHCQCKIVIISEHLQHAAISVANNIQGLRSDILLTFIGWCTFCLAVEDNDIYSMAWSNDLVQCPLVFYLINIRDDHRWCRWLAEKRVHPVLRSDQCTSMTT